MARSASRRRGTAGALFSLSLLVALDATPASALTFESGLAQLNLMWQGLMSSLRIKTAQTATSGTQVGAVALKAAEANASAVVQIQSRLAVLDATARYGAGRDQTNAACAPVLMRQAAQSTSARNSGLKSLVSEADQSFIDGSGSSQSVQSELSRRRSEYYCSTEEFDAGLCAPFAGVGYNTGAAAGDTNASVFMTGSAAGAEELAVGLDFADRIAPLPTVPPKNNAAAAIERIINLREAAAKSMVREVISGSIMEGLK